MKLPLLPIDAILCPHGKIPLKVFEPRYLDMVSYCLKTNTFFVAVMLKSKGKDEVFYQQGTLAKIIDFSQSPKEGVLMFTIEGVSQVKISDLERQEDGLWLSNVGHQQEGDFVNLPEEYEELKSVLKALVKHPDVDGLHMDIDFEDSRHVGWRLTELLPLGNQQKQILYEMDDPVLRLEKISEKLSKMID